MIGQITKLGQYKDLLFAMTLRDIQVRYKQTLLGAAWAVLQPVAFMMILVVLKTAVFDQGGSEGSPHSIFLYCAMVPWMFFQSSMNFATTSISGNMNLVKKIYFPREIFPASSILACCVDFCIASLIMVAMMVYYHIPATLQLLWVPVIFLLELLFVLSAGMFVAASNVFYRDIKYIVPLGIQILLFASPVIYSMNRVPEHLKKWYQLNPMAVVIDSFRKVILHGTSPDLHLLGISLGVAFTMCVLAYAYFKSLEEKFADMI